MLPPETIIWIITGSCNLRCPYCYASQYMVEKPLDFRKIYEILRDASELGVVHVHYTGGEPLTRPDLPDILRYTVDLGMEATVFTNSTLVDDKWAYVLSRYTSCIYTSLDGPREIYERVKGPSSWDKFIRGFKLLSRSESCIHVNIPVSRINYSSVDKAVETALELGVDSISVIPAMPTGRAVETKTYISSEEFYEALKRVDETARRYGVYVSVWCTPFLAAFKEFKNLLYSNCRSWRVIDLTPSGKIVLCDVMGIVIGDATREGLINAWNKIQRNELVRKIYQVPEECRRCPYRGECMGGCYARAYLEHRRIPAPDPLCPLTQNSIHKDPENT